MAEPLPTDQTPPAPEKKPRSQKRRRVHQRIGVFDDQEEGRFDAAYQRYCASAKSLEYGDSVAAFIRYMTIGRGARRLHRRGLNPALSAEALARLGGIEIELLRQGNNLNQIAKHLNAGHEHTPEFLRGVLDEHFAALQAIKRVSRSEE